MIARPEALWLGVALGMSACAPPPGPLATGTAAESPREIQQSRLREIPRDELGRIRQIIDRRRGRVFTPYPGRDSTRLGALIYATAAENEIRRLTDQARALAGNISALAPNTSLRDRARAHSLDMAARGQVSLTSSDGKTAVDWLTQAGIPFRSVGIRVLRAPSGSFTLAPTDTDEMIRARRQVWLNQSQGDADPLDPRYYDVGVGAVNGSDGNLYITAIYRQVSP